MASFTFQVEQSERPPMVRVRDLDDEAEALAYAQQLLADWTDSPSVDVLHEGHLLTRLRRRAL